MPYICMREVTLLDQRANAIWFPKASPTEGVVHLLDAGIVANVLGGVVSQYSFGSNFPYEEV